MTFFMTNAQWHILPLSEQQQQDCLRLADELSISELSASLLVRRGIMEADVARRFIRPSLHELHDPFLMQDMHAAVDRLDKAVRDGEKILVYGDYDVDGTTAVSLMYTFLSTFYNKLDFYIPDRYAEGYGISFQGIDYADEKGCSLIIALDCGIKSVDKVDYALKKGIDFIICDHHKPGDELPKAVAVLDPHREDETYPYHELSGCGVGFKLAQAYAQTHGIAFSVLKSLLPLLAMSIASDVVPMTGENRILEAEGLKQLNACPSVGLKSIMQIAGISAGHLTVNDLIYKIGPRVNACGRMRSGAEAVKLLITQDEMVANELAGAIDAYNRDRQDTDKSISEEALRCLSEDPENNKLKSTVVCGKNWHKGVVGIVASRLIESYYRPTIVLTDDGSGIISGSARSVADFDIYSAIDSCRDLLTNFGGHTFAAGLSMHACNLEEFKTRFEAYVAAHIQPNQLQPVVEVEAEINLQDITPQFYKVIRCLEPFGPGNPRPVFVTRNLINYRYTKRVGKQGEHLKLDVTDKVTYMDGIAFGKGDFAPWIQNGNAVDVCYELDENVYGGMRRLQMQVCDIKKCE